MSYKLFSTYYSDSPDEHGGGSSTCGGGVGSSSDVYGSVSGGFSGGVVMVVLAVIFLVVVDILVTNTSVAISLGTFFFPQISLIFLEMLTVYKMYSELISHNIAEGGPYASRTSFVKLLRSVKRGTLKLIETFLDKVEEQPNIGKQFVPPRMDAVLGDYARNLPDARESEVLSLFATIINKYEAIMMEDVPRIFEAVFQCTVEMITKNFEDYPEHRLKFFSLLRAIATHCFQALCQLSSQVGIDLAFWVGVYEVQVCWVGVYVVQVWIHQHLLV